MMDTDEADRQRAAGIYNTTPTEYTLKLTAGEATALISWLERNAVESAHYWQVREAVGLAEIITVQVQEQNRAARPMRKTRRAPVRVVTSTDYTYPRKAEG